jgi:hypothetical protein
MCLALFACGGGSKPNPPERARDAAASDAAPAQHDASAHDAASEADASQSGEPMTSMPDAATAPSCAAQSLAITQRVIAAIGSANANNRCVDDSDCVTLQPLHNSCYDGCTLPISKGAVTVIDQTLQMLEQESCPAFNQGGCTVTQPACQPPPPTGCQAGLCVTLSSTGGMDCENTSRAVRDRVIQAMALADRHCLTDSDCTVIVPRNACFVNCRDELILSLAGAASVQQTIDAATVDTCPTFFAGGCEITVAPCGPPTIKAKCIGKTCGPDHGP